MALPDSDGVVGDSLGLECDGVVVAQLAEVSGLSSDQDVIELKQNTADGKYVVTKLPGRPKAGEVTITRRVTGDGGLERWLTDSGLGRRDAGFGRAASVAVLVYADGGVPVRRYTLVKALPKSLETVVLTSGDSSILVEKLVITYEDMEAG